MSELKLNKKEQAWLERFQKTMAAAPPSISKKLRCYTVGDSELTLFDKQKFERYEEEINDRLDHREFGQQVTDSGSEITTITFPINVEGTSG